MSSAGGCPSRQTMVSVRTSIVPPGPCPPLPDTPGTSPTVTTPQVTASIHDFAVSLPENRSDKPPDRRGRRIQSMHDPQFRRRVSPHHRDGHRHHRDRKSEAERIRSTPPGSAPAAGPEHYSTQPPCHPALCTRASSLANEATCDMPPPWASATRPAASTVAAFVTWSSCIIDEPEPVAHPRTNLSSAVTALPPPQSGVPHGGRSCNAPCVLTGAATPGRPAAGSGTTRAR